MAVLEVTFKLLEALTIGRLIAYIALFTVGSFIVDFTWKPRYSKSLPRVGYGDGLLGTIKNWFFYVTRFPSWADEGYEKYIKKGHAFVVPSSPSRPHEIVVPRSQTGWLLEQPDRILSAQQAQKDALYSDYQFVGEDDHFSVQTIHRNLARHLPGLIPGVQEEIQDAIDKIFGKDTENWKSINLFEAWLGIIPQTTNRVIVSRPLCRDKEFLDSQVAFADAVVRNSIIFNMFPRVLLPLVAPFFVLSNWWHWRRSYLRAKDMIEERLRAMERKISGVDPSYEPPEDMVTWLIRQAYADNLKSELDPVKISKRLLPIEFAAIHTTVMAGHNLLLDLFSSDPKLGYLDAIREETARVLAESGSTFWTKQSLSRLYRTDSAIKESLRLSHMARALTHRKVAAPEGITNAAEGWHAPHGAYLMLDLAGTHRDPDLYPDPDRYNAFRFSRVREEWEASRKEGAAADSDEELRIMRLGMVTTSPEYLPFSHGRHACPGRFLVAHELKMILWYILQNYEIKPLPEKPKTVWFGCNVIPPVKVNIEVRRRKGTV